MAKRYYVNARDLAILHRRAFFLQRQGHKEAGGILVSDKAGNSHFRFLPNIVHHPYSHTMSASIARKLARSLAGSITVIGSFHSHPIGEAKPSLGDFHGGFYKGMELIYDVCGQEVAVWQMGRNAGIDYTVSASLKRLSGNQGYTFTPRRRRNLKIARG